MTIEILLSLTCVTMINLVVLGQTLRAYLYEIRWVKRVPRVPPFKVTQGRWNRDGPIGYIWLSMGLSRIISEINSDFGSKIANFPTPVYLFHMLIGFLGNSVTALMLKITRMPLPDCQKSLTIWFCGRTDRIVKLISRFACYADAR